MEMKTCTQCKQEYPKTTEYFYKGNKKYFSSSCKSCQKKHNANWRKNNPDKMREIWNSWAKNNPEKIKALKKKDREKHRDKRNKVISEWAKNNPDRRARSEARRRANKRNVPTEKYTEQQVLDKYGHNCYLCQQPIDFTVPRTEPKGFQVEHVIAISKGGPDTLENVRPSHAYCNWSKGNKALEDLSKS